MLLNADEQPAFEERGERQRAGPRQAALQRRTAAARRREGPAWRPQPLRYATNRRAAASKPFAAFQVGDAHIPSSCRLPLCYRECERSEPSAWQLPTFTALPARRTLHCSSRQSPWPATAQVSRTGHRVRSLFVPNTATRVLQRSRFADRRLPPLAAHCLLVEARAVQLHGGVQLFPRTG